MDKFLMIVIIGNSPGVFTCAIYLHTSNKKVLVLRNGMYKCKCTFVAGFPNISYEEYLNNCYLQAKNMGIEIIDANDVLFDKTDKFNIKFDGKNIQSDFLIVDESDKEFEGLQVISKIQENNEAIVNASAGCKASFYV